jgi:hypothetical protein
MWNAPPNQPLHLTGAAILVLRDATVLQAAPAGELCRSAWVAMSFDVYLQCYDAGQPAGIPRNAIRRLFPVVEAKSELDYWHLRFDDLNSCKMLVGALPSNPELLHSISVNRPCGDIRFFESVLAVMGLGNVVFYFPGCPGPLVTNDTVGSHLPADMIEALGQPIRVESAEEIVEIIKRS